ncbi:MAG: hypothetical protein IPP57_28620 [Candidatus Obscuribacter sp.]|jgi:purine nucleoside phosphorylase|nr:hypothetical protein [Candidatus Obscuribacter sp.]MBK9774744.1 hypothetical protein [Candidatus Obscuribacter sp.]
MKLRYAKRIDFTGQVKEFAQEAAFGESVIKMLRDKGKAEVAIVIDRAYGLKDDTPYLISDHLNLSGNNPLVGPNDAIGQRFPVVNNIYLDANDTMDQEETWSLGNPLGKMQYAIAAGLHPGVTPTAAELEFIHKLGAKLYCYNLVPTMIVAAHAGLKVVGVALPEGASLRPDILATLLR